MRTKEEILQILSQFQESKREEFGIIRLGIFGSAARNEMTPLSDVDVVVEMQKPDLFLLVGLKQELEALLQQQVDIVRYREHMNPLLKRRIDKEAIYV